MLASEAGEPSALIDELGLRIIRLVVAVKSLTEEAEQRS